MTFSLLARDPETGALGGAAATGNLCVGGWVLRGEARAGLSASQGRLPSTLWGEDSLALMGAGLSPDAALSRVTENDSGRAARQLALIAPDGRTAGFDGAENHPVTGHFAQDGLIVAGNWLAARAVIEDAAAAFREGTGAFEDRLLAALRAGVAAGSDSLGTLSAALLVVSADRPPLSLRVDLDDRPVERLADLLARTRAPDYAAWVDSLPTRHRPEGA
ncbi:MAG: DUF1028 domain-containing protein [Paracoccaceae bacterium]|nr:DUF1028 domain-containing protein [Paracoccaceae bacterium]